MSEPCERPASLDPRADGVLLIGHGTRDSAGTDEFFQLTRQLSEHLAPIRVEGCLLEFQSPTIPEAWRRLVERGVTRVHVAPLLLFAAGHARSDIPEALRQCAADSPGVQYRQCGPLSRARSIVELLAQRTMRAAGTAGVSPADDSVAVVMVGRGSYDPCAQADMQVLGEVAARRLRARHHAVGFYAMAQPALPGVLDRWGGAAEVTTVLVQPHLLFHGRLYQAIRRQVGEAGQRHPGTRFVLGDYLGPEAAVAEAIARRLALPGAARDRAGSVCPDAVAGPRSS